MRPGWHWGLLPLAALWALGTFFLDQPLRRDLAARAEAAIAAVDGASGARVGVDGRDVTLAGEALTAEAADKAQEALIATPGVRRVVGGLEARASDASVEWSATRSPNAVVLSGSVPDDATARELAALVREALPGLPLDDRQQVARGAAPGFARVALALAARLPRLAEGRVTLENARICIEGLAVNAEAYEVLSDPAALAQPGFDLAPCRLRPPPAPPFQWRAQRAENGALALAGHVPDRTTRAALVASARAALPEPAAIDDAMSFASGEPAPFAERAELAVAALASLRRGAAEITSDSVRISGLGPADPAACAQAVRSITDRLGTPASTLTIECPAPQKPDPKVPAAQVDRRAASLTLAFDGRSVIVSGAGAQTVALLSRTIRNLRPDVQVADASTPGGADVAEALVSAALSDLLRLDLGSVELAASGASLRGLSCREAIRAEVAAGALVRSGQGDVLISRRQTGCLLGPAASCQNRLDALSRQQPALFAQDAGAAPDAASARFARDAAEILATCPNVAFVIEGHAGSAAEEGGADPRDLSERRARRLRDELVGRGIAGNRLSVRGYGSARPLTGDASQAAGANRRLQFTIRR